MVELSSIIAFIKSETGAAPLSPNASESPCAPSRPGTIRSTAPSLSLCFFSFKETISPPRFDKTASIRSVDIV